MAKDFLGLRTEDEAAETGAAVRAENNQVDFVLLDDRGDSRPDGSLAAQDLAANAWELAEQLAAEAGKFFFAGSFGALPHFGRQGVVGGLLNVDGIEIGAKALGKGTGKAHGLMGGFGEIGGKKDVLEGNPLGGLKGCHTPPPPRMCPFQNGKTVTPVIGESDAGHRSARGNGGIYGGMGSVQMPQRPRSRVTLRNVLYATDFSEASENALPFAIALARAYDAKLHAVHIMVPNPLMYATPDGAAVAIESSEDDARFEMAQLESRLAGIEYQVEIERGASVWETLSEIAARRKADLIVVGTHGRTGAQKLLLGSTAETIFRQSPVPVVTIGPEVKSGSHQGGRFRCVLYATDLTADSMAAAPLAFSLAEENNARIVLLRVVQNYAAMGSGSGSDASAADQLYALHELVPPDAQLWCRPEVMLEFGSPAEQILHIAREKGADLIVLGARRPKGSMMAATHLERNTAHEVVAHSHCPVVTMLGTRQERASVSS